MKMNKSIYIIATILLLNSIAFSSNINLNMNIKNINGNIIITINKIGNLTINNETTINFNNVSYNISTNKTTRNPTFNLTNINVKKINSNQIFNISNGESPIIITNNTYNYTYKILPPISSNKNITISPAFNNQHILENILKNVTLNISINQIPPFRMNISLNNNTLLPYKIFPYNNNNNNYYVNINSTPENISFKSNYTQYNQHLSGVFYNPNIIIKSLNKINSTLNLTSNNITQHYFYNEVGIKINVLPFKFNVNETLVDGGNYINKYYNISIFAQKAKLNNTDLLNYYNNVSSGCKQIITINNVSGFTGNTFSYCSELSNRTNASVESICSAYDIESNSIGSSLGNCLINFYIIANRTSAEESNTIVQQNNLIQVLNDRINNATEQITFYQNTQNSTWYSDSAFIAIFGFTIGVLIYFEIRKKRDLRV